MIDAFFRALKKIPSQEDFENLYRGNSKASILRRHNLRIYLERMETLQPRSLLLGEAPGYKGCKLSGVPFSCESLLFQKVEHAVFGGGYGYKCLTKGDLEKERSAFMVWEELNKYPEVPLIWNIFPFHPHLKENPQSNRGPRVGELRIGQAFIRRLLKMYPIERIAAVGKKAYFGLEDMKDLSIEYQYIRHPSYGGKADFVKGIKAFMEISH
ncbi:MAG: uracil-DNA glycosylase [Bacteroidia bacterium]|nr:uracil-DNA glycosylase [Bacteroidia bacterium]